MKKQPGFRGFKNLISELRKNVKPIDTEGVNLSDAKKPEKRIGKRLKKDDVVSLESLIDDPLTNEEEGLEDTPTVDSPDKYAVGTNRHKVKKETNIFEENEQEISDITSPKKRFMGNDKRLLAVFMGKITGLFVKQKGETTAHSAALDFAESRKRMGKKGRKKRHTILYASTGFLAVVILVVAVLVPFGEAAPNLEEEALAESDSEANETAVDAVAMVQGQYAFQGDSAIKSTETIIATTPPDVTVQPTEQPTPELTPEPTPKPTPIPTTKPDPTPNPIPAMDELVDYFVVEADLYYNDVHYSSNHYNYTGDELHMLAQIIQSEAGGESYEGKLAVGNVVMNRVLLRGKFGSTITAVVTAANQFAYSASRKPSSSAKAAARDILNFEHWVIPQNVYYFRSGAGSGDWGSHKYFTKIGGHCFYTHSYSGRNKNGQRPPQLFERTFKYAQFGCKPEKRVRRIQTMLNKLGYDVYADSYYGKGTIDAMKEFQDKKDLDSDGIAGPSTMKALIKAYGTEKYYYDFCV